MEQCMRICSPWRGSRLEQKTAWGGRSSREELLWTDFRPHSPSLTLLGEERVKETGVKESGEKSHFYLGRRQKWGVDGFSYVFVSWHLIVYWFSCGSNWWLTYLSLSFLIFSPVLLRKGSKAAAGGASGSRASSAHCKCILLYVSTMNILIKPNTWWVIPNDDVFDV